MAEPIRFERNTFYPLESLSTLLRGTMSVKTFLAKLGLDCTGRARIFQNGVWGYEILSAMESIAEVDKSPHKGVAVESTRISDRGRGRPAKLTSGFVPVSAIECLTDSKLNES